MINKMIKNIEGIISVTKLVIIGVLLYSVLVQPAIKLAEAEVVEHKASLETSLIKIDVDKANEDIKNKCVSEFDKAYESYQEDTRQDIHDKIELEKEKARLLKLEILRLEQLDKEREEAKQRELDKKKRLGQQASNQANSQPSNGGGSSSGGGREVRINATAYCPCYYCTQSGKNITASGKQAAPGMIAAPSNIPFGSKITFKGRTYTVEDRGGAIVNDGSTMHIDVYFNTHSEALAFGRQFGTGYLTLP